MGTPFTAFPINTIEKADLGARVPIGSVPATACGIGLRLVGGVHEFFGFEVPGLGGSSTEILGYVNYQVGAGPILQGYLTTTDGGATTFISSTANGASPVAGAVIVNATASGTEFEAGKAVASQSITIDSAPAVGKLVHVISEQGATLTEGVHFTRAGLTLNFLPAANVSNQEIVFAVYPVDSVTPQPLVERQGTRRGSGDSTTIDLDQFQNLHVLAGGPTTFTTTGSPSNLYVINNSAAMITINGVQVSAGSRAWVVNDGIGWLI